MSTLSSYFGDEIVQQVADKMTESNGGKGSWTCTAALRTDEEKTTELVRV